MYASSVTKLYASEWTTSTSAAVARSAQRTRIGQRVDDGAPVMSRQPRGLLAESIADRGLPGRRRCGGKRARAAPGQNNPRRGVAPTAAHPRSAAAPDG